MCTLLRPPVQIDNPASTFYDIVVWARAIARSSREGAKMFNEGAVPDLVSSEKAPSRRVSLPETELGSR
jgi:hypothetical protein